MQPGLLDSLSTSPCKRPSYRSGAFTDNMKLPLHRWFRYSAGFSAEWAEEVVSNVSQGKKIKVLDPFCGSGTTLLAAAKCGSPSTGFETHPFVARIASIKMNTHIDPELLEKCSEAVILEAGEIKTSKTKSSSPLITKCYDLETLSSLEALRHAYMKLEQEGKLGDVGNHIWLAITCILRECSGVGTAQCQYVLPNKTKSKVREPFDAFKSRIRMFLDDLILARDILSETGVVLQTDARNPECSDIFDLVVTSPPYPNNYDYADATRIEMTFWEEVASWGDLHQAVRQYLIRSCSQHSAAEKLALTDILSNEANSPIRTELTRVCNELDEVRHGKGGRKTYHTMIAAYFTDLAKVLLSLRRLVKPGGQLAFMIGDSAPYGVYAPCDKWISELAISAGFRTCTFEKTRDRNIKWKNRTHTVPLKEGILWIEA